MRNRILAVPWRSRPWVPAHLLWKQESFSDWVSIEALGFHAGDVNNMFLDHGADRGFFRIELAPFSRVSPVSDDIELFRGDGWISDRGHVGKAVMMLGCFLSLGYDGGHD